MLAFDMTRLANEKKPRHVPNHVWVNDVCKDEILICN